MYDKLITILADSIITIISLIFKQKKAAVIIAIFTVIICIYMVIINNIKNEEPPIIQPTASPMPESNFQNQLSTPVPTITPIPESTPRPTIEIIEYHTPNDVATFVSWSSWDPIKNLGIDGNRYNGGIRVTISNMFNSMGSNLESKIVSRKMLILPADGSVESLKGIFILDSSMFGSRSYGFIKIIINGEDVFATDEINSDTQYGYSFDVNCVGADSIIIETTAFLRGGSFIFGIVSSND